MQPTLYGVLDFSFSIAVIRLHDYKVWVDLKIKKGSTEILRFGIKPKGSLSTGRDRHQ